MTTKRLASHELVLLLGKRGSGKSNRGKQIAREEMAAGARVVAIEIHDEWSKKGRESLERPLGPLEQRLTVDQVVDSPEVLDEPKLSLAIQLKGGQSERTTQLKEIGPILRATGNLTLFLEEVGGFDHGATSEINEIATQSRHSSMPVVLLAQRAIQVPKTAREQASIVISGMQSSPDDLKALSKLAGEQFADRVARLPRGQLLEWRDPR